MKLHYKISASTTFKNPVVTVGTFDGVHLGHKKLLEKICSLAKQKNGESVIVTFFPHPRTVINPTERIPMITSQKEKILLLKQLGIDHLIVLPFTKAFSLTPYDVFVAEYIAKMIKTKFLVVGYDHQFGCNRKGDFDALKLLSEKYNFEVIQIEAKDIDEMIISSTRIRKALVDGNIKLASDYLGHDYFILGKIVKGNQIGNKLGFPTANIHFDDNLKLVPANGVYAVKVMYNREWYDGMLNIGVRPTIGESKKTIEVHIFNFSEVIYKKEITVFFKARIRDEMKFPDLDSLQLQLKNDKEQCLKILDK